MALILRIAFGLALAALGMVLALYLGLFPLSNGVFWRTAFIVVATQCISFWVLRQGITIQFVLGLLLSAVAAISILNSRWSFAWEPEFSDGSVAITWRSRVLLLLIVCAGQGASRAISRKLQLGFTLGGTHG